jgi:hypothetical protein
VLIRRGKSSKKRVPRGNGTNGTSKIILRSCDHVRKAEDYAYHDDDDDDDDDM